MPSSAPKIDLDLLRTQIEAVNRVIADDPELKGDAQLVADMMEGSTDLHEFISEIVRRICYANAMSNALQNEIRDIEKRQDRYELRVEKLRELAFKVLELADVKKVEVPRATLSIRAGWPAVKITDETKLPDNVVKVTVTRVPAKKLIHELINQGVHVPGAELNNAPSVLHMSLK